MVGLCMWLELVPPLLIDIFSVVDLSQCCMLGEVEEDEHTIGHLLPQLIWNRHQCGNSKLDGLHQNSSSTFVTLTHKKAIRVRGLCNCIKRGT